MSKPELRLEQAPDGRMQRYRCTAPGCDWDLVFMGEGIAAEREGLKHIETHTVEMRVAEFMTVRGGIGSDAFSGVSNLVNVARAMFANEGIDLKTVTKFRLSVKLNNDFDDLGGDPVPMWDTFAEVIYPAQVDEAEA